MSLELLVSCRTHCFMPAAVPSGNSFTKIACHLIFINAKWKEQFIYSMVNRKYLVKN